MLLTSHLLTPSAPKDEEPVKKDYVNLLPRFLELYEQQLHMTLHNDIQDFVTEYLLVLIIAEQLAYICR